MLMRRFNLFLLLLTFAFAQIGLVTHELSHFADTNSVVQKTQQIQSSHQSDERQKQDKDSLNKSCPTCLAYSIIASSHTINAFVLTLAVFEQHYFLAIEASGLNCHFRYYPARAPPILV